VVYYFTVKAENGVGLQSLSTTNSDGQKVEGTTGGNDGDTTTPEKIKVWPNPFIPEPGHPMKFSNLTPGSSLRIYTLSGKLVKKLNESSGEAIWEGKNTDGKSISPGLYIYVVTDTQGNKKTGKLAISKQ
jgi:hypothetical protein